MDIRAEDKKYIWHPFTQMKTVGEHIPIVKGEKEWLYDDEGNKYIDAISSWWVNIHGHSHPYIADKIHEQLKTLEHVIFAGFTHEPAAKICQRLSKHTPEGLDKFFFSDNGSTAVEVAIKMALQYWHNIGQKKQVIIALEDAYHGDTFGAMSVGARSIFFEAFNDMLFEVKHIPIPTDENLDKSLEAINQLVLNGDVAAFIYEPLIQGSGGMNIYPKENLEALFKVLKANDVLLIADEVMTGFYRTGTFFASDAMSPAPDFICLSKGLTGGTLPMSLTVCQQKIFDGFLSEKDRTKTLYHGHSFTGNPIGCAAALASLDLIEKESCVKAIQRIEKQHRSFQTKLLQIDSIDKVLVQGTIIRFEIKTTEGTSYTNPIRNQIVDYCAERSILIRPLGNVVYIMPPYCIEAENLEHIYQTLLDCIQQITA